MKFSDIEFDPSKYKDGDLITYDNFQNREPLEKKAIVSALGNGYDEPLPRELIKELLSWKYINKSPYSMSFYNSRNIDWGHKPLRSKRIADHWDFHSQGFTHCETWNPQDVIDGKYQLGVYVQKQGEKKYQIIK